MDKKKFLFLINILWISILICSRMVLAAPAKTISIPELKVAVNKNTINIGDIIDYDITFQAPASAQLKFPLELENKTLGIFEIRDLKEEKVNIDSDIQQIIRAYKLTAFKVGEQVIPDYTVEYRLNDAADWQKISASSVKISVESVLEQEAEQLSVKPIKPRVIIWRDFWGWVIALIVIALIVMIVFLIKKYMVKIKSKPEIIIPAHLLALQELKLLEEQGLISKGKIEVFFEKLSGCMRHYLENRFHLRAPWMSTEEFLSTAKTSPILTTEHKHFLHDFLVLCDMVKFARYGSSVKEAKDSFLIVRNFVEQTKLEENENKQEAKK